MMVTNVNCAAQYVSVLAKQPFVTHQYIDPTKTNLYFKKRSASDPVHLRVQAVFL